MSLIPRFLAALAERMSNEDCLSDITYAMSKCCKPFMDAFMKEFQFHEFDIDQPWELTRENPCGSTTSRPDFIVKQEQGMDYLIENKINDCNYHFSQYFHDYQEYKRGFISAYNLDEDTRKEAEAKYGFRITRWKDFIHHLKENLAAGLFMDASDLVQGYINYVEEVCSIMELKEVRFDKLNGLHTFVKVLTSAIADYSRNGLDIHVKHSYKGRSFGDCWSGKYVQVIDKRTDKEIWPLYAIAYNDEQAMPAILIWFERDYNPNIYTAAQRGEIHQSESARYLVDSDGEFVQFYLDDGDFIKFCNSSLKAQTLMLQNFFSSVLDSVIESM